MIDNFMKTNVKKLIYVNCAYSLHSLRLSINLFATFPSYFESRSLLKLLILIGVVKSVVPYWKQEMNY